MFSWKWTIKSKQLFECWCLYGWRDPWSSTKGYTQWLKQQSENDSELRDDFVEPLSMEKMQRLPNFSLATQPMIFPPRATEAYKLVKVGSHNLETRNVRDIEMESILDRFSMAQKESRNNKIGHKKWLSGNLFDTFIKSSHAGLCESEWMESFFWEMLFIMRSHIRDSLTPSDFWFSRNFP